MTNDSKERKETPMFSGLLRYFPDALAAVSRLSYKGNEKHNPGEPLHWAREKSTDHGDCIVRHQVVFDQIDTENGEYHAVAVAWRALAQLQLLEEKRAQLQREAAEEPGGLMAIDLALLPSSKYDGDWNVRYQTAGFYRIRGDTFEKMHWPGRWGIMYGSHYNSIDKLRAAIDSGELVRNTWKPVAK